MKIYRRKEFLALPNGILFCEGEMCVFGPPEVKTHTYDNDFVSACLNDIDFHDVGDLYDKYTEMLNTGKSYPLDLDSTTRNGLFEEDALFLVYEAEDIKALIAFLSKCTYPEQPKVKEEIKT